MSLQVAKDEFELLSEFQKQMHVTTDISEKIISSFYRKFTKSTWYSCLPMKLKCAIDGEEVVYAVDNSFHLLLYTYMSFNLPQIRVRPEWKDRARVAWCHNVGTNIVRHAVFKENDASYHTWDNVWADIYFQFYQSAGAGKRENHDIGVGNVRCLEEWSTALPPYSINVEQPWFYSMDTALAFPMFYKHSQTRAEHRYTFRRRISDLLRVQVLNKNGVWVNCTRNIHRFVEINKSAQIRPPELWGRYVYLSEAEMDWHRCNPERVFYTRDVEVCDKDNPNVYGTTADLDLCCEKPCLALFWVAENRNATAINNYSNYTTNTDDLYKGWDPIKTTTLKYGTKVRLNNMASHHFSIAEPRKHFPSAPSERGFHGYSYASDSSGFHGDIGIVLSNRNAKLLCKIDTEFNQNYTSEDDDGDDDGSEDIAQSSMYEDLDIESDRSVVSQPPAPSKTDPEFITRTRLLVVRKFTISPEGEPSEKQYRFSIE